MKKILVLVLVAITFVRVTYADSWVRPVEQLYLSENRQFVAQVTPAKDDSPATLKVFLVRGQEGWISWQCNLGNEGAPQEVFVTDDGRYVVTVNENMAERWNEKGRLWASRHGIQSACWASAAQFMGRLRNEADRKVIESLLTDDSFYTQPVSKWRGEFIRYDTSSAKRSVAERNWYAQVPVHRITGYFWEYSFSNSQWPGSSIPFRIQGVTPGKYWLKAVWDKAKPYTFEDNYIKGPPQDGDFQSTDAPTITAKAGETVDNVILNCTHEVSGEAD